MRIFLKDILKRQVPFFTLRRQLRADFFRSSCDFRVEFPCRKPCSSVAERRHLYRLIRRHDPELPLFALLVYHLFNVTVRGLRFACVHDPKTAGIRAQFFVIMPRTRVAGQLVAVKYHQHVHFFVALVIEQHIQQRLARAVEIDLCQRRKLLPREHDIVPVDHKQRP